MVSNYDYLKKHVIYISACNEAIYVSVYFLPLSELTV